MPDPMEDIIAQHMTGQTDPETTDRRMECNIAARTKISCRCGAILDQERTVVVKRSDDRTIYVCCRDCFPVIEPALLGLADSVGGKITAVSWNETKEYSL